jgi:hypothetical protein
VTEKLLSGIHPQHGVWMIRIAFLAGLTSGAVTLWAIKTGAFGFTVWHLFDAVAVIFLAIGVLRRSYLCAWLLLGYHVVSRATLYFTQGHVPSELAFAIATIYFMGIVGITVVGRQERGYKHPAENSPDATNAQP